MKAGSTSRTAAVTRSKVEPALPTSSRPSSPRRVGRATNVHELLAALDAGWGDFAEGDCSGVRRAGHCGFQADGSLINNSEKGGFRFLCISTLSKGLVSLNEGHAPARQEQTGRQMSDRIGRFSPDAFGERHRHHLGELVTDRPGPSLEGFAPLDRLYVALAPGGESDERALLCSEPMSQPAQRLEGSDAAIPLPQS